MAPYQADTFPAAGTCVELFLAEKKDAVYESEFNKLLREVLESGFGAHLLSQLLPEVSALSSLLYYAISVGVQQPGQTLGEEFCDIIRVVKLGTGFVRPVRIRRHVLWLACGLLPQYLAARSQSSWKSLGQLTRTPRERLEQQFLLRQEAGVTTNAATEGSDGTQLPSESKLAVIKPQRLLCQIDRIVSKLKSTRAWIENEAFPASYRLSLDRVQQWGAHAHLAAFYVFARYLHVAKRIANIRYVFVRKDLMPGMNLSLLGYLVSLQLFATAIFELKQLHGHYKQEKKHRQQEERAAISATSLAFSERVPTFLSFAHVSKASSQQHSVRESLAVAPRQFCRKCALCLGKRIFPAATPCGHVFCWKCIVGWCQKNKAECPLCRQESHPQQIKCLYNYV